MCGFTPIIALVYSSNMLIRRLSNTKVLRLTAAYTYVGSGANHAYTPTGRTDSPLYTHASGLASNNEIIFTHSLLRLDTLIRCCRVFGHFGKGSALSRLSEVS